MGWVSIPPRRQDDRSGNVFMYAWSMGLLLTTISHFRK